MKTGNLNYDTPVTAAQGLRQTAVGVGATAATAKAADIAYYRSLLALAKTNNCSVAGIIHTLMELGQGGQ